MTSSHAQTNAVYSILLACGSFFAYSIADATQKFLGTHADYNIHALLAFPAGVSALLSLIVILRKRGTAGLLPKRYLKLHLVRAALTCIGSYAVVMSLQHTTLAQFYGVVFSIPFIVAVGGVIFFREHPGVQRWIAIILGFCGVWIAANPDLDHLSIGILYAAAASLIMSIGHLIMRKIGPGEQAAIHTLYIHGMMFIVNIALFLPVFEWPDLQHMPYFVLCGLSIFFAVLAISNAVALAPMVSVVMPFQYTQILWGICIGIAVFNEFPDNRTILGLCLIILSGLFLIWREYKAAKRPSLPPTHDPV